MAARTAFFRQNYGDAISYLTNILQTACSPAIVADAFFEYINRIRARPFRLQVQYNSWFDYGKNVTKEKFAESVAKVNQELVIARSNRPRRTDAALKTCAGPISKFPSPTRASISM